MAVQLERIIHHKNQSAGIHDAVIDTEVKAVPTAWKGYHDKTQEGGIRFVKAKSAPVIHQGLDLRGAFIL